MKLSSTTGNNYCVLHMTKIVVFRAPYKRGKKMEAPRALDKR